MERRLLQITCVFSLMRESFWQRPQRKSSNDFKWFAIMSREKSETFAIFFTRFAFVWRLFLCSTILGIASLALKPMNVKIWLKTTPFVAKFVYQKHLPQCLSLGDILFNSTSTIRDRLCRLRTTHFGIFTTMLFWNMRIINIIPRPKIKTNNEWL